MRILVCVKHSLDISEIRVNADTQQVLLTGVPRRLGEIDKNSLEAALVIRGEHGGTVHALTCGPCHAQEALRQALAMGADEATFVEGPTEVEEDPAVAALVLACAIQKLGEPDLIVCGEASDDGYSFQVPARLAERLAIPYLRSVLALRVKNREIEAQRRVGDGLETLLATLPCVLSVTQETNVPRRITLLEALQAKGKPLNAWRTSSELGLSDLELQTTRGLEQVDVKGIVVRRKHAALRDSDTARQANHLLDALLKERLLVEGG